MISLEANIFTLLIRTIVNFPKNALFIVLSIIRRFTLKIGLNFEKRKKRGKLNTFALYI